MTAELRDGVAWWSPETASFGAAIDVVGLGRASPTAGEAGRDDPWAGSVVVGAGRERCLTVDGLIDELALSGYELDPPCAEALAVLGERVSAACGEVEVVGVGGPHGGTLVVWAPGARLLPIGRVAPWAAPGHAWGGFGRAAIDTARVIVGAVWSRRWGPDEELFAAGIALELLASAGPCFSVTAASLCRWYLMDGQPTTNLGPAELGRIGRLLSAGGPQR